MKIRNNWCKSKFYKHIQSINEKKNRSQLTISLKKNTMKKVITNQINLRTQCFINPLHLKSLEEHEVKKKKKTLEEEHGHLEAIKNKGK